MKSDTIFIVTLSEWIFLWVLLVPYGMGQVTRLASRSSSFLGSRSASTTPFSRLELRKANSRHSDRLTIQMVLLRSRRSDSGFSRAILGSLFFITRSRPQIRTARRDRPCHAGRVICRARAAFRAPAPRETSVCRVPRIFLLWRATRRECLVR